MDNCNMTSEDVIVLLIYRNRSHLEDRRLPFAVCRQGIRAMIGLSAVQVSTVVRNLECDGFVSGEKRYVETRRGPCMAYSLTPLGMLRAKILELSNQVRPTSIRIDEDRVKDVAILNRRSLALVTKSLSYKIRRRAR